MSEEIVNVPKVKRTRKPNAKARFVVTFPRPVALFMEAKAKAEDIDIATMIEFDWISKFQSSKV